MAKLDLSTRLRRNRKSEAVRGLIRETQIAASDFIYPLFIQEGDQDELIESMPGCSRWSLEGLAKEVAAAHAVGVNAVVLFPAIDDSLKTPNAEESWNPEGLVPRAIAKIKQTTPEVTVITDVALDPYNSDGHDGVVENGEILNDESIEVLCKQALSHAEAGADIVAPSDMMDGRVGAIRENLDEADFEKVSILSYTAKYASAYYG
ncbi:MAG: porphobilinogen synthase, partial [Verrucomicrobiota bacterium]